MTDTEYPDDEGLVVLLRNEIDQLRARAEKAEAEVRNLQIRLIDARAEKQILTAALTNSEIRRRLLEPLHASTLDQSIRHSHQPFDDDGVTYCGWAGDNGLHGGCGELWPCSTVRGAT